MKISGLQFLRSGNLIASCSGALLTLEDLDCDEQLDGQQLAAWLACLPTTLRISLAKRQAPLSELVPLLLSALTEHVRLEPGTAQVLNQSDRSLKMWLPVDDRVSAETAVALILHILDAVRQGAAPGATTNRLWKALRSRYWNQTHAMLARAAKDIGVPFYRLNRGEQQFLQLGQGCHLRLCRETLTDHTPLFAQWANHKEGLHALLQHRGIPLPSQVGVDSLEQALAAAEQVGWPVVLKPADGGKGRGVWVRAD